jgi:hypothetical protein
MLNRLHPLLLLFAALLTFTACNGSDDDTPPVDQGQTPLSCGDNTGRLRLVVQRYPQGSGTAVSGNGAEVFFYATYEDFLNGIYLQRKPYNLPSDEALDTGCWNFGTYYIAARQTIGGTLYQGLEPVQIQASVDYTHFIEMY